MSTEIAKNKYFLKTKQFWLKYEPKIILIFGLILVAAISFETGVLKGQNLQKSPLVIEKTAECKNPQDSPQDSQITQNLTSQAVSNTIGDVAPKSSSNCPFVGSKNSNKYYPPTCSFAKRIKPENVVCFKNEQDAESKGYQKSASCFK
jgi:hypothetical protein